MAESELIKEEYPITVFHASDQTPEEHWLTSDVTKRWTDNPQGVSLKYPYEFVCSRVYTYKDNVNSNTPASQKKGWKAWDVKNIALWAHYGKDASPFKLILENSEDQVYFVKNVIVLDEDLVGTGKITLTGFDGVREITEFNILDNSGKPVNISWGPRNGDRLTGSCLYKNGNWTLDLEIIKTFRSGETSLYEIIVKDCQLTLTDDSFTEIIVKDSEGNDTAKTAKVLVDNFCKIPIQAKCEEIQEAAVSVFKIKAVHDINGDGIIGRWNLIPSVRQIKYREESRNDSSEGRVTTVQSYEPENITFRIEYDPLLESPKPITEDSGYTYGIKVYSSGTNTLISDNGTLPKETIAEIVKAGGATAYLYINDPDYSDRKSESIGGVTCYEVDSQEIYVSSSIAIEGAPGGSGDYYSLFFDNPTAAIGGDLSYVKVVLTFMHSVSPVLLPNLSINGNIVQLPKDRGEQNEKIYTSEYHGIPGLTIKLYFDAYNNYNITFDMPNPPDTELLIPFTTTQDSNTYRATFRLYKSGTITVDRTVSLIGQASRIRNWESGKHYFPVISSIAALKAPGMQNTLAGIGEDEVAYGDFGGENLYCPRFYDIVYYGTPTATGTPMWQAKAYSSTVTPTEGTYWTSANQFDFVAANSAFIKDLAAKNVQAERILVKDSNSKIVAGLINGESAFNNIKEDLNGNVTKSDDIIFFAGLPDGATSLADAAFTVNRDGTTKIGVGSEGGTSSGGSGGSSGITEEDIKKWNLLTVNGKFLGDVEAKTLKAGNSDNYMKFCTLSEALTESGKEVVIGGSGNIKSDTMVVLIKSGSDFFVLNPLDLAKGSGIDVQSTLEIYERLSLTSSNYYVGTDDVIYEDPNCLNPVKEGTIWYEVTGEAVFGQQDPSDVISEDVGLNVISVMAYKYTEYERTSSGKQKTGRYGYYIPKGWDKYGNPQSGGGFIDMVQFITGNYGKLNRYTYKNVTYNRTIYYILPRAIYYGSGTVSTYELTSAEEMIQPDGPEEIIQ